MLVEYQFMAVCTRCGAVVRKPSAMDGWHYSPDVQALVNAGWKKCRERRIK